MPNFVPIRFSGEAEERLCKYLRERIMALEDGLQVLHETKITRWRAAYEAKPREEIREFPYHGAHNLIAPIIAIFSDTLLARVMSALLKTRPPWVGKLWGSHEGIGEGHRVAIEELMEYVGIEPEELDLYRVYHEWCGETIKYGTSIIKAPHEVRYKFELDETAGDGSGSSDSNYDVKPTFTKEPEYQGPRPEKIAFEDFLIPPRSKTLDTAEIIIHKRKTTRAELEERRFFSIYDPAKVDRIINSPDRTGPDYVDSMREQSLGASMGGHGYAEWDLYECWLKWPTPDGHSRPRIIATFHKNSSTLMRGIYDTHTLLPYSLARLFFRDDMIYGYGFCETQANFQEEISEIHNSRLDNRAIANARVWRVNPDSKLHAGYRIYPSATVPAEKDEIEALACGDVSPQSIEDEQYDMELAERRAGVSPPMQGMGAGTTGKKGIYSSMGTLALMQEGNRRTDLNISDFRYAHTRLGRIILADFVKYGIRADLLTMFGSERTKHIQEALAAVKDKRLGLPVYSSTASVNKEVEKQNDFILVNLMRQHYMGVGQLIAQVMSVTTPPELKKYLIDVIKASNSVMKSVLRNFDKDDVDELVPEPDFGDHDGQQGQGPGQQANQAIAARQPGSSVVNFPGGSSVPGFPSGLPAGGRG